MNRRRRRGRRRRVGARPVSTSATARTASPTTASPTRLRVIAGLGYAGVALTLDQPHLDPFADDADDQTAHLRARLDDLGLAVVVETGTRYLLDP